MIDPVTTAAALASAEQNTAALISRAKSLAGKPAEADAWILAGAAEHITNNLRAVHNTYERRTA